MRILAIIPARGGSKGIPGKNIKELCGKPLIAYTIDIARQVLADKDICVSTDNKRIIDVVENYGLRVPFIRPPELATDQAGTHEVLIHALNHYESQDCNYDTILLLQPTSPFRLKQHIEEAILLYDSECDMVVSVKETSSNPYYNLFEEENGYLNISKGNGGYIRRQDAPKVWEYNGSIYVINVKSLKLKKMNNFSKTVKYPMDHIYSIDIDNQIDWIIAESIIKEGIIKI